MSIPNHGVYVVGQVSLDGDNPTERYSAWRKTRLLGRLPLAPAMVELIDELDSELFGSELEVRADSRQQALEKLDDMGFSLDEDQVSKVVAKTGDDGELWQQLLIRGELGSRATTTTLLNLLKRRHRAGEVYLEQRASPKRGTLSFRGYLPGYDSFAELFEGFARALGALATFDVEGWVVFLADTGLTDPNVCHRIEVSAEATRLCSFDPHGGGEEEYLEVMGSVDDEALSAISGGYATWLQQHEGITCGQRWAGRAGYLKAGGSWLVEPSFRSAHPFHDGRAAFRDDRWQWGYLDEQGQVAIEPQFFEAADFQDGLARVRVETDRIENEYGAQVFRKYGFIDHAGHWCIEPRLDEVEHFFESRAAVTVNERKGYIDPQGELVCEPRWKQAFQFMQGRALVSEQGQYDDGPKRFGFIDPSGELAIPLDFESAGMFQEGLALAYRDDKWGYIDQEGQWVIDPTFDRGGYFQDGLAIVIIEGQGGIIDRDGSLVVPPRYSRIEPCGQLYEVRTQKGSGCIDRQGNVVIDTTNAELRPERHGLIPVRPAADGPWGYRTATGDWAIKPRFAEAFQVGAGRAIVALDDKRWAIIDHCGDVQVTLDGWITDASHFASNGVAWVARQASYGLVRQDGELLLDICLEHVFSFGDPILCVQYWAP